MAFKKGHISWLKGTKGLIKHTEEWKKRMSEIIKKNGNLPPIIKGEKHWNWKGGNIKSICKNCGKNFETKRKGNNRKYLFCSLKCSGLFNKDKMRERMMGNKNWLGKHHTKESKKKIRLANLGKHHSEITKEKLRQINLGRKASEETKQKMSERMKKNNPMWKLENKKKISEKLKGRKLSKEICQRMSERRKGQKGIKHSEETKKKMRKSAFEYAQKVAGIICPRIGKNEKNILNKLEQKLNYKIIRQFKVEGYFIDGYIPELKLAIEIDERPKNMEKDIEREKIIKEKLDCGFLRIKDYD